MRALRFLAIASVLAAGTACLADLPRLKALRERHSRSDFEILGISLDASSRRTFISWLQRNRVDWPQIHESRGYNADTPRLFGVDRLPMTILVGRDGSVAAVGLRGERLDARIEHLLGAASHEKEGGR